MRLRLVTLLATAAGLVACAQTTQPTPKTDDEKAMYSLGVIIAKNMGVETFHFTGQEMELVKAGFVDGTRDKQTLTDEEMQGFIPKLQELQKTRVADAKKKEQEAGTAYLAKAAAEAGATKLESGVIYKIVKEGTGANPTATDTVKVNYEGRLVGGKVFDSSEKHGGPAEFPLGEMIPCWTQAVPHIKVGGKGQLVCPAEQAYGLEGPSPLAGSTLVFDVEVLEIVNPAAEAAATPAK